MKENKREIKVQEAAAGKPEQKTAGTMDNSQRQEKLRKKQSEKSSEKQSGHLSDHLSLEETILYWIENHVNIICLIGITIAAVMVRIGGKDFESGDYVGFLLPWYNEISENGGFAALDSLVGDYNAPYQFLIAVLTYIPMEPLYLYKILSILFDFVLAVTIGFFVCSYVYAKESRTIWQKLTSYAFVIPYGAVLFTPTVILNSSVWAQCDVIYSAFAVMALYFLYQKKYLPAFILFGVGFSYKLQAIFILPLFIYVYFREKKFSILNFAIIPLTNIIMCLPSLLIGLPWSDFLGIYTSQTDNYPNMYLNYPSFWMMVGDNYDSLKGAAVWITLGILAIGLVVILAKKVEIYKGNNFLILGIWTVWTCLAFLPCMHERYGYILEMLLLIQVFFCYYSKDKKGLWLSVVNFVFMEAIISACYGKFLFGNNMDHPFMAIGYFLFYANYTVWMVKTFTEEG